MRTAQNCRLRITQLDPLLFHHTRICSESRTTGCASQVLHIFETQKGDSSCIECFSFFEDNSPQPTPHFEKKTKPAQTKPQSMLSLNKKKVKKKKENFVGIEPPLPKTTLLFFQSKFCFLWWCLFGDFVFCLFVGLFCSSSKIFKASEGTSRMCMELSTVVLKCSISMMSVMCCLCET